MPYGRRRRYPRRVVRRRFRGSRRFRSRRTGRRRSRPTKTVIRSITAPVADSYYTKLKYTETISFTGVTGMPQTDVWQGNSAFSPKPTGVTGSTQPYGYDQLTTFYQFDTVLGSKIKLTMLSAAGASGSSMRNDNNSFTFSLVPVTDVNGVSGATNMDHVRAFPYSKWKAFTASYSAGRSMQHYMSTKKMFGANKRKIVDDDDFSENTMQGGPPFGPAQVWYWVLFVNSFDTSDVIRVVVDVTYYVKFWFRRNLAISMQ